MIFFNDELVPLAIFQNFACTVWNFAFSNYLFTSFILFTIYLLYKLVTFTEVVVKYIEEVPPEVRQLNNDTGKNAHPPYFPNGWIPILESRALGLNQVKSALCLGLEVAVVRGAAGQAYVIDAFCPHLGANFAVGGQVYQQANPVQGSKESGQCSNKTAEDCVRCPFHGWSFRLTDGQCSDVPYEDSPMNVKVKVWTSVEVNGYIFVWHHVLNEPPSWELVPVPEIASKEWAYCGRTDHTILAHPQEILENAADLTHLPEIHTAPFISSNFALLNRIKKWKIFEHNWAAQWSEGPAPHQATVKMVNPNVLFGRFTLFTLQITILLTGPAHVEIFFESDGFLGKMKGAYMEFVTPISPLKNRIVYHTWIERKGILSYLIGKFLLYAEAKMVERDIQIWNRKAFVRRPLATKTEKPLIKYRRWYKQFYSTDSIDW